MQKIHENLDTEEKKQNIILLLESNQSMKEVIMLKHKTFLASAGFGNSQILNQIKENELCFQLIKIYIIFQQKNEQIDSKFTSFGTLTHESLEISEIMTN